MTTHFARTALVAMTAAILASGGSANAAPPLTGWVAAATFKTDLTLCALRFSLPKDSYTVSVEVSPRKGARDLDAKVIVGGLPPYLDGKKGTIRDLQLNLDTVRFGGIKATWAKGDKANNSRIFFTVPAAELVPALASARTFSVDFELSTGVQSIPADMTGSAAAAKLLAACIAA